MKHIIYATLAFAALIALSFALKLGGLEWDKFFKPRQAAIEREVFTQTRSYNEAKLQELSKYRLEYLRAVGSGDTIGANAIRSTIRHTFAEYDPSKLPAELSQFLKTTIYQY